MVSSSRRRALLLGIAASALLSRTAPGAKDTIKLVGILELSGAGAAAGTSMQMGLDVAANDINARGGILGRHLDVTTFDTQSSASIAKSLAQRAVDMQAYAVIGPIFSGSALASTRVTGGAQLPNFTGAAASSITEQGNPYVFRISLSQAVSIPRIARYVGDVLRARRIALVWANNDFGKGGRDAFVSEARSRGMELVVDDACEVGEINFASQIARVQAAGADLLFPYLNEEECARLLRQLRERGYPAPIVGDATAVSQKVIDLAGDAANGVVGHVALTADAPNAAMQRFVAKFKKVFNQKPDHNAIAGYMAPHIVKVVTERIGRFDRRAFAQAMRGAQLNADVEPGIITDLIYDMKGDPVHASWIVKVEQRRQVILTKLPANA